MGMYDAEDDVCKNAAGRGRRKKYVRGRMNGRTYDAT
jgi:hypothetical protein